MAVMDRFHIPPGFDHQTLMDSGLDWMDGGDCVSFKWGFVVTRERDIISQPAKAAIIKARV